MSADNAIKTIDTGLAGLVIEMQNNGDHRIVDQTAQIAGEWTDRRSIATLALPESMWQDYGKNAHWVWLTSFWDDVGNISSEKILVIYEPE